MAQALRVLTLIDSDTLRIPELVSFIGRHVEVIVVDDEERPAGAHPRRRMLGALRGQVTIPDDFDAPLPAL